MVWLVSVFVLLQTALTIGQESCSTEGEVRLVDGRSELEGRLEVCVNGEWGTVCDDDWGKWENSNVVCDQLIGQSETVSVEGYRNNFGPGNLNQQIVLDDVKCVGNETSLTSCQHGVNHNCQHVEDVGVSCILISNTTVEAGISNSFNFSDTVTCTDSLMSIVPNATEIEKHGHCVVYLKGMFSNPCDVFYTPGVSRVYIPEGRAMNEIITLNELAANAKFVVQTFPQPCRDAAFRMLCYFYFPPCGSIKQLEAPRSFCKNECDYITNTLCVDEIEIAMAQFALVPSYIEENLLQFINCSNPGAPLDPLPHCCSNAGIIVSSISNSSQVNVTLNFTDLPIITIAVPSAVGALILSSIGVVIAIIVYIIIKKSSRDRQVKTRVVLSGNRLTILKSTDNRILIDSESASLSNDQLGSNEDHNTVSKSISVESNLAPRLPGMAKSTLARIPSSFTERMSASNLLIPGRHINLMECIGKGEFGVVYQGHLTGWMDKAAPDTVAVKTLRGTFSKKAITDLIEESLKMKSFNHPNVLNLIGVCIDAGEAPYIVMPYMANGSLLSYLKQQRPKLTIVDEAEEDLVVATKKQLLSMCFQIAKGMEYLASRKFVHRDLAARNCMIDTGQVIKVADFGLTEDIYSRNYFRQGKAKEKEDEVKLPIRWMAPESLIDGLFNEKTDVWSFGVTCWEVFSVGRTPYPTVEPFTLVKYLEEGRRLDKPSNAACSDDVYGILMVSCWNENGADRPSFSHLVQSTNHLLDGLADYLQLSIAVVSK